MAKKSRKPTEKQVLKKAGEYRCRASVPVGLSHAFMAIYSLTYGLQGGALKKRARQAQFSFTKKNNLDDYTTYYGKWRVLKENKSPETIGYLQKFIVGFEERSAIHSGSCLREGDEDNEVIAQKDRRRKSIADQVVGHIYYGIPLSKRYKKQVERTKSEYKNFVGEIGLEIYCEGENLEVMDVKKTSMSNQALMFDLLTVRSLSNKIATKLEEKFKDLGHLTKRGKIFNKASERVIREEVETYFNDILFDYIEEMRKNSKISSRLKKLRKKKGKNKEKDFSHLTSDEVVGEVDRIDEDDYMPPVSRVDESYDEEGDEEYEDDDE